MHTPRQGSAVLGPDMPPVSPTGLVRVTLNITPRSHAAMRAASRYNRDSLTVTVNRALVVYGLLAAQLESPDGLLIVGPDGTHERLRLA